MTMTMPADRITTLEIRAAEQERTIEELSGQIAEQWKTIERLQKKIDALAERFLALEEQTAPDIPHQTASLVSIPAFSTLAACKSRAS